MLIQRRTSQLVIIDMQEKLASAIPHIESLESAAQRLLQAASAFEVPIWLTEHCAERIGPTVLPIRQYFTERQIIHKIHFSACIETGFQEKLRQLNRPQIVIGGIEAHVCVLQTALELQTRGYSVFLVDDACGSRQNSDKDTAISRARQEGIRVVSSEMVLFEWTERADTAEFKNVLKLVKSR